MFTTACRVRPYAAPRNAFIRLKHRIAFLLGPPGAGKSTVVNTALETLRSSPSIQDDYQHLYPGELLRNFAKGDHELASEVADILEKGSLVPAHITVTMLGEEMRKADSTRDTTFLVDGFPRALSQASEFESRIGHPDLVIKVTAPDDVLENRILKRGVTSGRADDNIDSFHRRMQTHDEETGPVYDRYHQEGLLHSVSNESDPKQAADDLIKVLTSSA